MTSPPHARGDGSSRSYHGGRLGRRRVDGFTHRSSARGTSSGASSGGLTWPSVEFSPHVPRVFEEVGKLSQSFSILPIVDQPLQRLEVSPDPDPAGAFDDRPRWRDPPLAVSPPRLHRPHTRFPGILPDAEVYRKGSSRMPIYTASSSFHYGLSEETLSAFVQFVSSGCPVDVTVAPWPNIALTSSGLFRHAEESSRLVLDSAASTHFVNNLRWAYADPVDIPVQHIVGANGLASTTQSVQCCIESVDGLPFYFDALYVGHNMYFDTASGPSLVG